MTYQQPDNKTVTSCKDCVLAVYENNTQVSCFADRIDKVEYVEAYDNDKEFYVVERFCNYYRDNKEIYVNNGVPNIEKIKSECRVTFDLLISCNNIDNEYEEKIKKIIETTKDAYDINKVKIHFLYTIGTKENLDRIKKLQSFVPDSSVSYYSNQLFFHTLLLKSIKSYHLFITKENVPDHDILNKINNLVNEQLKKLILIENNGVKVISNLAYKITSIQNSSYIYNDIIENIYQHSQEKQLYHYE